MLVSNPILTGFHPDPCAVRVGKDWYIAVSTFEWFPGVRIYHSTDLANWALVARPLDSEALLDMSGVPNSGGVWAPCLSYCDGMFYLVYSITRTFDEATQDTENYLTCAKSINGPWSPRVRLHCGGFDTSLFHDADGTKWIVGMRWDSRIERNHFYGIYLQEYNEEQQQLIGDAKLIFSGTSLGLTEGPHLYQIDGWYYLMVAEGGTSTNHAVVVCRSRFRDHGYEADPKGAMLTAKDSPDCPVQYAGHGSLVQGEGDAWYLFHLGARKSLFGGWSVLGRETHVQNVIWQDGFPRLQSGGHLPELAFETGLDTHAMPKEPLHFTFAADQLPLALSSLRTPLDYSLQARQGWLRLHGHESMLSHHKQTMVGIQLHDVPCIASTIVDCTPHAVQQAAGLSAWYHTANFYVMLVTWDDTLGRCLRIISRNSKHSTLLCPMLPLPSQGEVGLRMTVGFDQLQFAYDIGKGWQSIITKEAPVHILSDEYANLCGEQGFTGCFITLCCQDQTGERWSADFKELQLTPCN